MKLTKILRVVFRYTCLYFSAAYCYYAYERNGLLHNASEYEFFVSKLTRDYSTIDNGFQTKYEVCFFGLPVKLVCNDIILCTLADEVIDSQL